MNTDISEKLFQEEEEALRVEESVSELQDGVGILDVPAAADEMSEIEEVLDDSELLLSVISEQAAHKRIWQIGCAFLAIFFTAGCLVFYSLHVSGENQTVRLESAKANIQTAGERLLRAEKKVKALEAELTDSKVELKRVTGELVGSKAKVGGLEKQLTDTSGRLKDLQDRNEQVVRKMKKRLEQL